VTAAELETFLQSQSPSWSQWRRVLVEEGVLDEAGLLAEVEAVQATLPAGQRTVAGLRHAMKGATRERLLDWMFAGGSAADAHARLLRVSGADGEGAVARLNSSDAGNLAEQWYRRYRRTYSGEDLVGHPLLVPGAVNPDITRPRFTDHVTLDGRTLVEQKATAERLSERDTEQIGELLRAVAREDGAVVRMPDGRVVRALEYRLTFTSAQGALQNADTVYRWLDDYEELTVEVFGADGVPRTLQKADLMTMDVHTKLTEWAGGTP
jgi:hypothetical protein